MHTGDCLHIKPSATERKGENEIRADGDWFSFNSIGEAKRFFKVKRLNGLVRSCLLCKPLDRLSEVSVASLDVKTLRAGCYACTVVEVRAHQPSEQSIGGIRRLFPSLYDDCAPRREHCYDAESGHPGGKESAHNTDCRWDLK